MFLPQSILDAIDNPIILKNEYGVALSCNKSYAKLHQAQREKILGFTCENYLSHKVASLHMQADISLLNSPEGVIRYLCQGRWSDAAGTPPRMITKSIISTGENSPRAILTVVDLGGVALDYISKEGPLTPRETSVLTLLVKGGSQKQIARDLLISPHTVAHYCKSIYVKLGVNSRTEAQLVAITRLGIIP